MNQENFGEDIFSNSDENQEKNPLQTRDLTVLEKEAFERAKIRHKENIVQPQVVQGKVFKGVAFISKPEKIIFKDFNLGEPVSQTIYLTNVSFSFNSFKLMPMKETIKDFFEIFYKPSGEISAGMSCPITIRFTPQKNEDISDCLPLLAKTGPIMIPLICTCKKAIVRIDNPLIDFGNVIYGEVCTRKTRLENQGALETDIIMKTIKGADLQKEADTSSYATSIRGKNIEESEAISRVPSPEKGNNLSKCLEQLKFQRVSKIQGYSTLEIPFTYIPGEKGEFNLKLLVYFENFMYSPPVEITLKGECVDVPIYVERPIYDFQICFLNHIYREKLVFFNRSPNPMKIQIIPPKETRNFFEFNPILGYIQGNSSFEIWVKMNTEKEILNYCSKYIKDDLLEIPFKLIGANQLVPVYFTIKARLTIDTLQINPSQLDFGKIYEGCAVRLSLGFKNLSTLPKELLFYPMPSEIRIEPDLIPLHILPKENLKINLVYRGEEIKKDDTFLTCKIINGNISVQDIRIPYCCEIIRCPLKFSAKKIELPVLQIDEKTNSNINIRNLSQRDIIIEFFLPDLSICGLKMATMVATIAPQKSVDINIEYTSFFKKLGAFTLKEIQEKFEKDEKKNFDYKLKLKAEEEETKKRELEEKLEEEKSGKKGVKKPMVAPEKKIDPANAATKPINTKNMSKKQQQEYELELQKQADLEKMKELEEKQKKLEIERNFDMAGELLKLGGKFFEFQEGTPKYSQHYIWLIPCYFKFLTAHDSTRSVIYLEVSTVSVEKSLITNKSIIDFGEIAVGFGKSEDLLITNKGDEMCYLKMDLLPLVGGFNVINALRPVAPGETKRLIVQFQPNDQRYFEETLRVYCLTSTVSVKLKGKGVKPEVRLTPENGLLNAGNVVLGEYAEKTFKVQNVSNFAFDVKLRSLNKGIQNQNRSEVFAFIPSEFSIQSQEEIDIKVIFKPDRVSERFHQSIVIDVPNQKTERILFLYGSCYPRQAFLRYYQPYLAIPTEEELKKNIETPFEILKLKDEETVFSPSRNKILLEFMKPKDKTDNREQCFSRKILVGNCKLLDSKAEKNSNYEITMPKDDKLGYFSCDNLKGAVTGNQENVINFNFKPPQMDPFIENIDALQGIGQWIEQKAEIKISGGYFKAGCNDLWSFEIILKAYINQI